jgi:hypothetical protein
MLNHKAAGQITYIDQIVINNNLNSRTIPSHIKGDVTEVENINPKAESILVYSGENSINVITPLFNSNIAVYNSFGVCVYSRNCIDSHITIPIKEKGIYIVKNQQFTKKVTIY